MQMCIWYMFVLIKYFINNKMLTKHLGHSYIVLHTTRLRPASSQVVCLCLPETQIQRKHKLLSNCIRFPPPPLWLYVILLDLLGKLPLLILRSYPFARNALGMYRAKSAKGCWKCGYCQLWKKRMHLHINVGFSNLKYLKTIYDIQR